MKEKLITSFKAAISPWTLKFRDLPSERQYMARRLDPSPHPYKNKLTFVVFSLVILLETIFLFLPQTESRSAPTMNNSINLILLPVLWAFSVGCELLAYFCMPSLRGVTTMVVNFFLMLYLSTVSFGRQQGIYHG